MDIKEIKILKEATELTILNACKDFEKATGVNVENISIINSNEYVFAIARDLRVKIEIKID